MSKPGAKALDKAKKLVYSERAEQYGDAKEQFRRVAGSFTLLTGTPLKPEEVPLLMTLVKLARQQHKHKQDNIVDAIGYLALMADIQAPLKKIVFDAPPYEGPVILEGKGVMHAYIKAYQHAKAEVEEDMTRENLLAHHQNPESCAHFDEECKAYPRVPALSLRCGTCKSFKQDKLLEPKIKICGNCKHYIHAKCWQNPDRSRLVRIQDGSQCDRHEKGE